MARTGKLSKESLLSALEYQIGIIEEAESKAMSVLTTMFREGDKVTYNGKKHTVVGFDVAQLGVIVKSGFFGSEKLVWAADLS